MKARTSVLLGLAAVFIILIVLFAVGRARESGVGTGSQSSPYVSGFVPSGTLNSLLSAQQYTPSPPPFIINRIQWDNVPYAPEYTGIHVSPLVDLQRLDTSIYELRHIAFAVIYDVTDPVILTEFILTRKQFFEYFGGGMPCTVMPDRNAPVYVVRVGGNITWETPQGVRPDYAESAVDILEARPLAGGLGIHGTRPIDLLVEGDDCP